MPPASTPIPAALGGDRWNTLPETGAALTAREFFTAAEPLLQGVIDDNAITGADREVLRTQIRATLALGTRETSLPLAVGPDSAPAARELGEQAERIGRELAAWADAALDRLLADRIPLPAGPLVVRSHCYGHLLTHEATDLLMGRRGGPVTMQLYNEWLHQIVLLRDALLPFTDWRDVPLPVTPTGLRHTEPARDAFLTELMVRRIRHAGITDFARRVLTGGSGPDGYGFEANGGAVLPAVLDRPLVTAPRYLLTWRPAPEAGETVTYVVRTRDYYAAPRTLVEDLPPAAAPEPLTARVVPGPAAGGVRTADIEVTAAGAIAGTTAGTTARVDLGQALRGHRFAHRPDGTGDAPAGASRTADVWAALRAPGLVWTQAGDTALDAAGLEDLAVLALLGGLYPENVALAPAGRLAAGTSGSAGTGSTAGTARAGSTVGTAGASGSGNGRPSRLVVITGPPQGGR